MPFIIAIVIIVLGGVTYLFLKDDTTIVNQPTPQPAEQLVPAPVATTTNKPTAPELAVVAKEGIYIDGTYKTKETYLTPQRTEYLIDVSLTIRDDVVTDATVIYSQGAEKDPNPQRFDGAYKTLVIGKKIDSISLSRVGGASLTTAAFNKALEEIKTDARS
jgi:hypothetical protein